MQSDPFKKVDAEEFVRKGDQVYAKIRSQYEPKHNGKYLAIEPESKKVYLGKDGAEAMAAASKDQPDKVFYLVKIGFTAAETIARSYLT